MGNFESPFDGEKMEIFVRGFNSHGFSPYLTYGKNLRKIC
jgi:hypothetical protein